MNITELTPPPVARTFSIEFTEDEFKTLGILMGNISKQSIKDQVGKGYSSICRPNCVADNISHEIFFTVERIFKNCY